MSSLPMAGGSRVLSNPFRCCQLLSFVDCDTSVDGVGDTWLQNLENELLQLKFHEKNNDLYQFRQVGVHLSLVATGLDELILSLPVC